MDFGKRYKIIRRLGAGGMAEVHLCRDTELNRLVAIKKTPAGQTDPVYSSRLERECQIHAKIGPHPHIVTLYDRMTVASQVFLVMEYVEGATLAERIAANLESEIEMPYRQAIHVSRQCLLGLRAIHNAGTLHRDIKPENLMLTLDADGQTCVKILDFGAGRFIDHQTGMQSLTVVGNTGPGTPSHMSPEQWDSKQYGQLSRATDFYACGVTLYQCLCNHPPFMGTISEIVAGHLHKEPPEIDSIVGQSIPQELVEIVNRALRKNPSERYQSAEEFISALAAVDSNPITNAPTFITPPRFETQELRTRKKLRWPIRVSVSITIGVASLLFTVAAYIQWSALPQEGRAGQIAGLENNPAFSFEPEYVFRPYAGRSLGQTTLLSAPASGFQMAYDVSSQSVVYLIHPDYGITSGIIVRGGGWILTTSSAVRDVPGEQIDGRFEVIGFETVDEASGYATVHTKDVEVGLAVLRFESVGDHNFSDMAAQFPSEAVQVLNGDQALLVGNHYPEQLWEPRVVSVSLVTKFGNTESASARIRQLASVDPSIQLWLEDSQALSPTRISQIFGNAVDTLVIEVGGISDTGSAGDPIVDDQGMVLGIRAATFDSAGKNSEYGLFIHYSEISDFLERALGKPE